MIRKKVLHRMGVIVCGVILMLAPGNAARAHHQLGLPHYLYSEKYPQIPTMVIDADAEGYMVTFSIYPGNPQPGEIVRIKIYIRHTGTGAVYTQPITLSVSKETFLGGVTTLMEPVTLRTEYNEYKLSYEFPNAEQYFVNVTFQPRDAFFEKIPFPIVIGETNFSLIPIIAGGFFLTVFLLVGFTKKRQQVRTPSTQATTHAAL